VRNVEAVNNGESGRPFAVAVRAHSSSLSLPGNVNGGMLRRRRRRSGATFYGGLRPDSARTG
jgi:hypothetical protein